MIVCGSIREIDRVLIGGDAMVCTGRNIILTVTLPEPACAFTSCTDSDKAIESTRMKEMYVPMNLFNLKICLITPDYQACILVCVKVKFLAPMNI